MSINSIPLQGSVRSFKHILSLRSKDMKLTVTNNGGTLKPLKVLKPMSPKEGPVLLNEDGLTNAESRILSVIEAYQRLHGMLPRRNYIRGILKCKAEDVSSVLARLRRETDREEKCAAYMESLINPPRRRLRSGKLKKVQQQIDHGEFALLKAHSGSCHRLTFVCPSDSEAAYLALCDLSAEIPHEIMKRLLPKQWANAQYVWRWETQGNGRLHLHILVELSLIPTISRLSKIWKRVLNGIDDKTACNPFICENGNRATDGDWVHLRERIEEKQNQEKYPWSYLAADRKYGKTNIARRWLSMLNGEQVQPRVHGGASAALVELCRQLTEEKRFPLKTLDECKFLIDEVQRCIIASWQDYGPRTFRIGRRCHLPRDEHDLAALLVQTYEGFYSEGKLPDARYELVIKLSPNRRLHVYRVPKRRKL